MYITKTTSAERMTISNAMFSVMDTVERAERQARAIGENFFSADETGEISKHEAQQISDGIYIIANMLYDACIEYALTVNEDFCNVELHRESAKNQSISYAVDRLAYELIHTKDRRIIEAVSKARKLEDVEALKELERIKSEFLK